MSNEEYDQRLRHIQRQYVSFLEDGDRDAVYDGLVKEMIANQGRRLTVNMNDLRRSLPDRAKQLLENSSDEVVAFQRALKEFVASTDSSYAKECKEFFVGFEGSFGSRHVTPRSLTSRHINNMVCIEGIVNKVSLVRPKVVTSVHYCPATAKTTQQNYSDLTSLDAYPSSAAYPTQDEDGNLLQTEYGLSTFRDNQSLTLQELPEKAPTGQLPRSMDVICENDLVDRCKPGDRVQIVGTFRCLPGKQGGFTSGTFRTVLLANNVILKGQEDGPTIGADDVLKCKRLAKQKNIVDLLARSLAPSIHGHEYVKKALLCMMLGGVEKILPNGTRLRGDINILLIGDPSVAKSQMLRYVLATSARAVATTGRGSSGVGLTAAVTTDQETGERRLEAGAMVLADRGIVCIDEFDKMTDMDRTAIHEVMEQGRVTISKAGIHARLNARCSVLAAANPVYGRYDPFKTPMDNIGLQDSLLSRFDLLFVLLDTVDEQNDRKISDHVVRVHRYRDPREADGAVTLIQSGADELTTFSQGDMTDSNNKETPIWDNSNALRGTTRGGRRNSLLSMAFVKKYIEVAKCLKPVLSEEACEVIGEEYSKLRSVDFENTDLARTQPVTARALETLIRLSTALAKARLANVVSLEDALSAIELVQYAYFKRVLERQKKKRQKHSDDEDTAVSDNENDDGQSEGDHRDDDEHNCSVSAKPPKKMRRISEGEHDSSSMSQEESAPPVNVSPEDLSRFQTALNELYEATRTQELRMEEIMSTIPQKTGFSQTQISALIARMSEQNKVFLSANVLYRI